jgi:hypothetical protein
MTTARTKGLLYGTGPGVAISRGMAKDREPNREERRDLPEDLPGNQTDMPGRRTPDFERPNKDVERTPGEGGAKEKI